MSLKCDSCLVATETVSELSHVTCKTNSLSMCFGLLSKRCSTLTYASRSAAEPLITSVQANYVGE